jgi:phosphatidylglycerophosphate synthase
MNLADALTEFRSKTAPILGVVIAATNENTTLTALTAGSMATDYFDGMAARKGAELARTKTRPEGAVEDPGADKDLVNALAVGLVGRYVRQKRFVSAAVLGLNHLVTQPRDKRMDANRAAIVDHDLDKDKLKAIKINKLKTAGQFGSLLVLMSPAAEQKSVRAKAVAAYSVSTILGLIGEQNVRIDVQRAIAQKKAAGIGGVEPIPLFGYPRVQPDHPPVA